MCCPRDPLFGPGCLNEVVMGDVEKGFQEAEVITEGNSAMRTCPIPSPPSHRGLWPFGKSRIR